MKKKTQKREDVSSLSSMFAEWQVSPYFDSSLHKKQPTEGLPPVVIVGIVPGSTSPLRVIRKKLKTSQKKSGKTKN